MWQHAFNVHARSPPCVGRLIDFGDKEPSELQEVCNFTTGFPKDNNSYAGLDVGVAPIDPKEEGERCFENQTLSEPNIKNHDHLGRRQGLNCRHYPEQRVGMDVLKELKAHNEAFLAKIHCFKKQQEALEQTASSRQENLKVAFSPTCLPQSKIKRIPKEDPFCSNPNRFWYETKTHLPTKPEEPFSQTKNHGTSKTDPSPDLVSFLDDEDESGSGKIGHSPHLACINEWLTDEDGPLMDLSLHNATVEKGSLVESKEVLLKDSESTVSKIVPGGPSCFENEENIGLIPRSMELKPKNNFLKWFTTDDGDFGVLTENKVLPHNKASDHSFDYFPDKDGRIQPQENSVTINLNPILQDSILPLVPIGSSSDLVPDVQIYGIPDERIDSPDSKHSNLDTPSLGLTIKLFLDDKPGLALSGFDKFKLTDHSGIKFEPEPTENSLMGIYLLLGDMPAIAVVVSGATHNFVNAKMLPELEKRNVKVDRKTTSVQLANGESALGVGTAYIPVATVTGEKIKVFEFVAVRNLFAPLVINFNTMRYLKLIVDLAENQIWTEDIRNQMVRIPTLHFSIEKLQSPSEQDPYSPNEVENQCLVDLTELVPNLERPVPSETESVSTKIGHSSIPAQISRWFSDENEFLMDLTSPDFNREDKKPKVIDSFENKLGKVDSLNELPKENLADQPSLILSPVLQISDPCPVVEPLNKTELPTPKTGLTVYIEKTLSPGKIEIDSGYNKTESSPNTQKSISPQIAKNKVALNPLHRSNHIVAKIGVPDKQNANLSSSKSDSHHVSRSQSSKPANQPQLATSNILSTNPNSLCKELSSEAHPPLTSLNPIQNPDLTSNLEPEEPSSQKKNLGTSKYPSNLDLLSFCDVEETIPTGELRKGVSTFRVDTVLNSENQEVPESTHSILLKSDKSASKVNKVEIKVELNPAYITQPVESESGESKISKLLSNDESKSNLSDFSKRELDLLHQKEGDQGASLPDDPPPVDEQISSLGKKESQVVSEQQDILTKSESKPLTKCLNNVTSPDLGLCEFSKEENGLSKFRNLDIGAFSSTDHISACELSCGKLGKNVRDAEKPVSESLKPIARVPSSDLTSVVKSNLSDQPVHTNLCPTQSGKQIGLPPHDPSLLNNKVEIPFPKRNLGSTASRQQDLSLISTSSPKYVTRHRDKLKRCPCKRRKQLKIVEKPAFIAEETFKETFPESSRLDATRAELSTDPDEGVENRTKSESSSRADSDETKSSLETKSSKANSVDEIIKPVVPKIRSIKPIIDYREILKRIKPPSELNGL